jgi:hypothetical protein
VEHGGAAPRPRSGPRADGPAPRPDAAARGRTACQGRRREGPGSARSRTESETVAVHPGRGRGIGVDGPDLSHREPAACVQERIERVELDQVRPGSLGAADVRDPDLAAEPAPKWLGQGEEVGIGEEGHREVELVGCSLHASGEGRQHLRRPLTREEHDSGVHIRDRLRGDLDADHRREVAAAAQASPGATAIAAAPGPWVVPAGWPAAPLRRPVAAASVPRTWAATAAAAVVVSTVAPQAEVPRASRLAAVVARGRRTSTSAFRRGRSPRWTTTSSSPGT